MTTDIGSDKCLKLNVSCGVKDQGIQGITGYGLFSNSEIEAANISPETEVEQWFKPFVNVKDVWKFVYPDLHEVEAVARIRNELQNHDALLQVSAEKLQLIGVDGKLPTENSSLLLCNLDYFMGYARGHGGPLSNIKYTYELPRSDGRT